MIQNLNPKNAYGHDNFSISMLKISGSAIYRLLEITNYCLFSLEWKKGNLVPIQKS